MNRFTFWNGDGYNAVHNDYCYEDVDENCCGPAIDRLAAYEDNGLLPEEVAAKAMWADSAAKALSNILGNVGVFDLSMLNDLKKPAEQRWISVTERLPEMKTKTYKDGNEMGSYDISDMVIGYATDGTSGYVVTVHCEQDRPGEIIWTEECGTNHEITHWMPLPEPPKEENYVSSNP